MSGKPRRVPLSLEDLKRKRDAQEAELSKVVFVPKDARGSSSSSDARAAASPSSGARAAASSTGAAASSTRAAASSASAASAPARPPRAPFASNAPRARKRPRFTSSAPVDAERDAIRRHYMAVPLGSGAAKARPASKAGERTRFKFEWDADEDTVSAADDALYRELRDARRRVPGMDEGERRGGETRRRNIARDVRHWSEKPRDEMTDRDWAIFREDHAISFRGGAGEWNRPARAWEETRLPKRLLHLVRDVARYSKPSPIQMAAIPVGLRGRDLIGLAETGSGKTAAFVLPMLVHVQGMPALSPDIAIHGPYVLVLAPTRELVLQIESETKKFADPLGFRVASIIGGQGLQEQGLSLQNGCEVVVCTPGRMVDLLSRRLAVLGNCSYLIMDEADRMIDMGFEPQVQEILKAMPSEPITLPNSRGNEEGKSVRTRQTFMFSATMSPPVERLAREYLVKPVIVTIGEAGKAAEAVDQRVEYLTSEGRKRDRLVSLVRMLDPPIIVFVNTKKGCEDVARLIESNSGVRPVVLHSGKSQDQREECLEGFKTGRFGVLVATDVLGRGIDIKGVSHVVNFELPKTMEPYTHRIGRTGRAGRKGTAWSLATSDDAPLFGELRTYLEQSGARVPAAIARHDAARSEGLRPIID